MTEVERVNVDEAQRKVTGGALLVCAYADEEKCNKIKLEGAISLTSFQSRLASLSKDQEIVFYCG